MHVWKDGYLSRHFAHHLLVFYEPPADHELRAEKQCNILGWSSLHALPSRAAGQNFCLDVHNWRETEVEI